MSAGPARGDRNRLGGGTAARGRGSGGKTTRAEGLAADSTPPRTPATADRMDGGLLLRPPRQRGADGAEFGRCAERPGHHDRIPPHGRPPRTHDAAATGRSGSAGGRTGDDPRAGGNRGRIGRRAARAGQSGLPRTGRSRLRPPLPPRTPRFRRGRSVGPAASRCRNHRSGGEGRKIRALPARRRDRIGQDRDVFRTHRRCAQDGTAGARPPAGDRADRSVPVAVRGAVRGQAGSVAFLAQIHRTSPRVARHCERDRAGRGWRPVGAVPALCEARPDRGGRGARGELQAG